MVALLGLVAALAGPPPVPPAAEVEELATQSRAAIRDLHLRLRFVAGSAPGQGYTKRYQIWWDANHQRTDSLVEGPQDREKGVGFRDVECRNCERPGHSLTYSEGLTGVWLADPAGRKSAVGAMFIATFDPRLLGHSIRPHVTWINDPQAYRIDTYIRSPVLGPRTVEAAQLDGVPMLVLRSKLLKPAGDITVWVAPGCGHAVRRLEFETWTKDGIRVHNRVDSELAQHLPSKLWFPKRTLLEMFEGDKLWHRGEFTVESVAINEGIDPNVFTLAGLGILNGATVNFPNEPPGKSAWWDGQVIPRSQLPPPPGGPVAVGAAPLPVDPAAVSAGGGWWYSAGAVVFAVAAVFFLRRAFVRRK